MTDNTIIFLQEVINTAAVKELEREAARGKTSPYHAGVIQGAALALAAEGAGSSDSIIAVARERAKRIFANEDWRRDCDLYDNLVRRFG
jgi:hypothetical protein